MISKRKAKFSPLDKIVKYWRGFISHIPVGSKGTKLFYRNNVGKNEQTIYSITKLEIKAFLFCIKMQIRIRREIRACMYLHF